MKILVTGGLGYIGSHTCVALLDEGYDVVIADDLSNSRREVLGRIAEITGKTPAFYELDVIEYSKMAELFEKERPDGVIHFAGYKSVPESVEKPLKYYSNNVGTTLILCDMMQKYGTRHMIFSSSATVYGDNEIPYREDMVLRPATNPYGRTKAMSEDIIRDFVSSASGRKVPCSAVLLRYFNPVGAHESGLIGEDPNGIPGNLMPYIQRVAAGKLPYLNVYGNDYPTPDGTGVRDYIHVMDLAEAHVAALRKLEELAKAEGSADATPTGVVSTDKNSHAENTCLVYNIGTGRGTSVLELVAAFERATGIHIERQIAPRRPGDLPEYYADSSLAQKELNWNPKRSLDDICKDAWKFQQNIKEN
jgi:UDP-glucose 4-epimerase